MSAKSLRTFATLIRFLYSPGDPVRHTLARVAYILYTSAGITAVLNLRLLVYAMCNNVLVLCATKYLVWRFSAPKKYILDPISCGAKETNAQEEEEEEEEVDNDCME